jgi:hypothetical protein
MSLKWVYGDPPERSSIHARPSPSSSPETQQTTTTTNLPIPPLSETIIVQPEYFPSQEKNKKGMENMYERINNREKLVQTHQNPFLVSNSYVQDIENQDKYLRCCYKNDLNTFQN